MSELISGKEAKLAWVNGEKLQIANTIVGEDFYDIDDRNTTLNIFDLDFYRFRLKPRTITINGIEVPAPFEPKLGEKYWIIETSDKNSYSCISSFENDEQDKSLTKLGAWRTEEEIKQVVSALRSIFKGGV